MDYYHTNDEIDEIGEGLIRKYQYSAFVRGEPTDIKRFIIENLGYQIIYDRIAEREAGKMAFLSDGRSTLWVWRNGIRAKVVPPMGHIVLDEYLNQDQNTKKRRFVLAHEAGHIIMDRLGNNQVKSAFRNEFDGEQEYSVKDLAAMFSIAESMATAMGVALLMPKTLVVGHLRNLTGRKRIPLYGNSVLSGNDRKIVGETAEHFQVSFKSMFYRLRDLRLFEPRDLDEYLVKFGGIGGLS